MPEMASQGPMLRSDQVWKEETEDLGLEENKLLSMLNNTMHQTEKGSSEKCTENTFRWSKMRSRKPSLRQT